MSTTMSKKKSGEADDRSGRRTAPIQVEKDLARMAAVIASHDGITQADLVSPVLRPFLLGQYARVKQAIDNELKSQPKPH